jgi:hypothetical protein
VLRFFQALLPHFLLTALGVVVGGILGLVFDVQVLRDGGLGPAAAHAGAFVLFFLAAVPVFLALVMGSGGLALSLVVTILWDVARRRWRRRTLVRLTTLLGGSWAWIDLLRARPPEEGWTVVHYVAVLLVSLVMASLGCGAGLVLAKFLPSRLRQSQPS